MKKKNAWVVRYGFFLDKIAIFNSLESARKFYNSAVYAEPPKQEKRGRK